MGPIYFLVVNYYSSAYLRQLLTQEEFAQCQPRPKVLIVNNSPDDAALPALMDIYTPLSIVEARTNIGFGAACNLGLQQLYQQSPEALVWLLNPDTVLQPGAIAAIQDAFCRAPEIAILGTGITTRQGQPWFEVGRFNRWWGTVSHRGQVSPDARGVRPSRWVSGCSMILNLARFGDCPQFDPHFFLYYEDTDLCERYHQQGCAIAVTPDAWVIHHVSSLANQNLQLKWTYATFSKLYFLKKHGTWLARWLNVVYILLKIGRDGCRGNWQSAYGRWQGLQAYMSGTVPLRPHASSAPYCQAKDPGN